jgi:hypothetical protein
MVAFSKYLPDDESMSRLAAVAVTDRCDEFVTPQNAARAGESYHDGKLF